MSSEYYAIEMKDMRSPFSVWHRIEASWECPNAFGREEDAILCARTLALRHNGASAFRVVDANGIPGPTFVVITFLQIADAKRPRVLEEIPPDFEPPMLRDVLP